LRYEYLPDTGIEVVPVHGHLISIGVALQPVEMW
jgi:hypothetical protein